MMQWSFDQDFFLEVGYLIDLDVIFFGTFAPILRSSESPIAIAFLQPVTFLPDLPLFKVLFFRLCFAFLFTGWLSSGSRQDPPIH
jgi:hypothetical protein